MAITLEIIIIVILSLALVVVLFFVLTKKNLGGVSGNFIKDLQLMFVRELQSQQVNIDEKLTNQNKEQVSTLNQLNNRLEVIRSHEETIAKLNRDVLQLNQTLANPISRGVFGETQLENLLANVLPANSYQLQVSLSSGSSMLRADCLIKLPYPPGNIVIDAKFPYKSWLEVANARSSTARQNALTKMGRDIRGHIKEVSKYVLINETANYALMFIPAESVFAAIHSELPDIVEEAYDHKVFFASPSTLLAILNTVRSVLKDIQVVKHSKRIRIEVEHIANDANKINEFSAKVLKSFLDLTQNVEKLARMGSRLSSKAKNISGPEDDSKNDSKIDTRVNSARKLSSKEDV